MTYLRQLTSLVSATGLLLGQDTFSRARERMVREDLEARGIRDRRVLEAMRATPRHLFVPVLVSPGAYDDRPWPIGHGATISQPYVVALMTELLRPEPKQRVLEIGTGSGYQAAILSQLAAHVYTIELEPELARSAAERLMRLGYNNVEVRQGDGYKGWPEAAPFDGIMITAAPPEVPQTLLDQLAKGGRLVAPVGVGLDQELVLVEKSLQGKITRAGKGPVLFVPLRPEKQK